LDIVAIKQELEELLGHKVDVLTEASISPYLRERILTDAIRL
jgi:predicted nucleotidyltransferase